MKTHRNNFITRIAASLLLAAFVIGAVGAVGTATASHNHLVIIQHKNHCVVAEKAEVDGVAGERWSSKCIFPINVHYCFIGVEAESEYACPKYGAQFKHKVRLTTWVYYKDHDGPFIPWQNMHWVACEERHKAIKAYQSYCDHK